jgi:hypothetical protein
MEHLRSGVTEVWTASQNVPLIRFADSVGPISASGIELLGLPDVDPPPGLFPHLASFDRIVSWYGASRAEFRAAVTALPFEFHVALPPAGSIQHASDFFLAQVGGYGPACPRIQCAAERRNFAVIHPFSGSPRKNWPLERFREFAAHLSEQMPVHWCAGPHEELPEAVRFDDLYELASWLASACLYVGNDSGISHLAAAVGTPVLAIFVSTDPRIWAPRGNVRIAPPGVSLDQLFSLVDSLNRA